MVAGTVDREKLVTWLNDRADEEIKREGVHGMVHYAIYTGLRDRILRGDYDEEGDE